MKISISKKFMSTAILPVILVVIISSVGSAVLLGSNIKDEVKKQLALAVYAIEKECEAATLKTEVNALLEDFKTQNDIDITIFDDDMRVLSTVPNAVGTKMDPEILAAIQDGDTYFSKNANVNGERYYAYYNPVLEDGKYVGAYFAGSPTARVDKMITNSITKVVGLCAIGGLVVILGAMWVVKRIVKKLEQLKTVIDTLTTNDLAAATGIGLYDIEHDEIETISNESVKFSAQLGNIIRRNQTSADELKDIASELRDASKFTADTSREISAAVESITQGAVKQAEETDVAKQRIGDMSNALGGIKNDVDDLHIITDSMNRAKENVQNTLSELEKVNTVITKDVYDTYQQVSVTSQSVDKIGEAAKMIEDVAEQTMLLSLNASIEAAHAGEHGRGFAVVAEEIGKLASQSAESAEEIKQIIKDLEDNYSAIIKKVENTTDNMLIQNDALQETKNVFTVLEGDVNKTVERTTNISSTVDNLNNGIKDMVNVISNVSDTSQNNSASTQEIMASIESMSATISQVSDKAQTVDESADVLIHGMSVFKTE